MTIDIPLTLMRTFAPGGTGCVHRAFNHFIAVGPGRRLTRPAPAGQLLTPPFHPEFPCRSRGRDCCTNFLPNHQERTMRTTEVTTFNWGDIALNQVVFVDGVPHATRAAIGEWLEYDDPAEGVRKLLNRNEYIEAHSVQVKLAATDGKNYDTLTYHPIGFLLIVMESGQPKAKEMKQAVAEFVWHFAGPQKLSAKERMELLKLRRTLLNDLGKTKDAFVRQALLADLGEVSLRLGQPVPEQALLGKDANQIALPGI